MTVSFMHCLGVIRNCYSNIPLVQNALDCRNFQRHNSIFLAYICISTYSIYILVILPLDTREINKTVTLVIYTKDSAEGLVYR